MCLPSWALLELLDLPLVISASLSIGFNRWNWPNRWAHEKRMRLWELAGSDSSNRRASVRVGAR
jgi:hypothetical protein